MYVLNVSFLLMVIVDVIYVNDLMHRHADAVNSIIVYGLLYLQMTLTGRDRMHERVRICTCFRSFVPRSTETDVTDWQTSRTMHYVSSWSVHLLDIIIVCAGVCYLSMHFFAFYHISRSSSELRTWHGLCDCVRHASFSTGLL